MSATSAGMTADRNGTARALTTDDLLIRRLGRPRAVGAGRGGRQRHENGQYLHFRFSCEKAGPGAPPLAVFSRAATGFLGSGKCGLQVLAPFPNSRVLFDIYARPLWGGPVRRRDVFVAGICAGL
jgi:hypothetical protein